MRYFIKHSEKGVFKAETDSTEQSESFLSIGWVEVEYSVYVSTQAECTQAVSIKTLAEENKLLKAQLQAQTDRSDFIEDCIAEMATQVYGGV